jgi:hypothetical protein
VVLGLLSFPRACTDLGPTMCGEVPNRHLMDDQIDRDGLCVAYHGITHEAFHAAEVLTKIQNRVSGPVKELTHHCSRSQNRVFL